MAKNNHRSVNIFGQPAPEPLTLGGVSIVLTLTTLVSMAVLVAGKVNASAIIIFILLPVLAVLVGGRRYLTPSLIASLTALASLVLLQLLGALPQMLPGAAIWLNTSAVILAACVSLMTATWVLTTARQTTDLEEETSVQLPPLKTLPEDGPILIIETSPLGRVSSIEGNRSWCPALKSGDVFDLTFRDADGESLATGLRTLADGTQVLVHRQVTEQLERWFLLEAELLSANPDSESHASELQERTVFFASLGHDLKSPLNSVIGFAEMMDDEILGPMPEAYSDYPGLIRESGRTLLRLVEDFLGYARAEAGTFELDLAPLDVAASGQAVMRQNEAAAKQAGVKLELKSRGEVMAMADAGAVQRIWDNLVSNAIKYSDQGGLVRLSAVNRGDTVKLSVTDHGAGMDADDLARIAKPFSQGGNAKGRSGSGLGLALVNQLAELHGGQVVIRTSPGEGTQVVVTLPAVDASDEAKAAE